MDKRGGEKKTKNIRMLLFKSEMPVRVINFITLYRIITFPLLVFLALTHREEAFKWLLAASFFTDAIDGTLARKYNATSVLGAKLDSIGDDLTVLAGVVGLLVTQLDFIKEKLPLILILFGLFLIQLVLAIWKYKKFTSFHTYLAKTAAVITAVFMLSAFFFDRIIYPLFYATFISIGVELIEEIVIIFFLTKWKTNVKGLYWILRGKTAQQ